MTVNALDKASALATETLAKIKPQVEKATEESKDALGDNEKVEGKDISAVEKSAKEDERILSADDKTLTESEATRKTEILGTKKEKAESPEDKVRRTQEASQKRIDEIKSELLAEQNKRKQDAEAIEKLREELADVKKTLAPKVQEDEKSRLKALEADRIIKYAEEDKNKPLQDRREMSKEDLENWYLEDPVEATAWMQERTIRRVEERRALELKDSNKKSSEDFTERQNKSRDRLFSKYPGVNPSPDKLASFKGKTDSEIREALCAESEEFRICSEIVAEDPKKYLDSADGPELIMAEMDKRLSKGNGKPKTVTLTEEELEAKIQAEAERRANLDEGITSTKGGKKMDGKVENKSERRQHLERIAKKAGIPIESLDKTIEKQSKITGRTFKDDND